MLLAAALIGAPLGLQAQSPDWTSSLAIPAFPSPYVSDWERVPSTGLLSVTYTGTTATDFLVSVSLTSTERGFIGTIESPTTTLPGGPVTLLFNARDAVFDWNTLARNRAVTDQVFRTGQIPEGRYRACATVLRGTARTAVSEACADFTILLPDPPQLVTPLQGDVVRAAQPFFSWTPVLAPPEVGLGYRLRLVEVIGRQAPSVALAANIPLYDGVVLNAPFLLYPLDGLPLEASKTYAWQVTATSADGQQLFRDKVASEIHVFTMSDDLLGPLGPVAQLGDEAVIQPGVAVLRGLRSARVRPDLAAGAFTVDGALSLVLLGLPGTPVIPVQVNGLQVAQRGSDAWMVGGEVRVSRPRGLLPASANGLARIRELVASSRTGVTASVEVGAPGQGTITLGGTYLLTALGWYGRREGVSTAPNGFASLGRAQARLTLARARLDLPSGALELGGRLRLFGAPAGCEDFTARADDGVLRGDVNCRGSGAIPFSTTGPTDYLVESVVGRFTADILADTLGYELGLAGRVRLFGANGTPCHVDAVLRLVPDSVQKLGHTSRCTRESAAQQVAPWLALRYEFLQLDSIAIDPAGALYFKLGFQIAPELTANPKFVLPAFVNAYATRDSLVLPELPDLLVPDVTGVLDQFRIVWRRGAHARVERTWRDWKANDATPFAWRLEADAFFDPQLPGLRACLASDFKLSPAQAERIRIAGGRVQWTIASAKHDPGCRVDVAPGLDFTTYRLQGDISIALANPTRTVYPEAVGVLGAPTWPPPVVASADVTPEQAPIGGDAGRWAVGAFETLKGAALDVVGAAGQAITTAIGSVVNGVLDGRGICNKLAVPIDGRGRLIGSAEVKRGCDVTLGIGRMTPYGGEYAFGAVTPTGQAVRWVGGTRISMDSSLAEFDDAVKAKQEATLKAEADAKAKAEADAKAAAPKTALQTQIDAAVAAFTAKEPNKRTADSLQALKDDNEARQLTCCDTEPYLAKGTPEGDAKAAELEKELIRLRDSSQALTFAIDAATVKSNTAIREYTKTATDSLTALNPPAAKESTTTATAGTTDAKPTSVTSGADALLSDDLPAAGPSQADSPESEIDWTTGRIIRGKWTVKGPFVVQPIPGLAFRLRNAVIDTLGLKVDGSFPVLYLKSTDSAMTQWAGVHLNLGTRRIDAGLVSFSQGLAMEIGTADEISGAGVAKETTAFGKAVEIGKVLASVVKLGMSAGSWQVRPPAVKPAFVNGVRVDVSQSPVLDGRGLSLRGDSPITSALFGSTGTSAKLRFSDDFALRNWTTVSQGSATLEIEQTPVAIWTPAGWRPAVAELLASKLPKRLALPKESVAYIQLRDAVSDELLVNVTDGGSTWRLSTPLGPVKLVVPALASALGGTAPSANVSFDIEVDKTTFALASGSIEASVKGVPGFDLAARGVPFALERVRYDRDATTAGYRLGFTAGLSLLGEESPTGRVTFTIDGNGQFAGDVSLPVARAIDLGTPEVKLLVNGLAGSIAGNVSSGFTFQIDATGGVQLALEGQTPWTLGATLRLTPNNAQFVNIQTDMASMLRLGVPGAALLLGNPRLPLLAYDRTTRRIRFDMLFDLGVEIAALSGVKIPAIRDIHIRETGILIPAFELSDISSQMLTDRTFGAQPASMTAAGFSVRPLALRMGAINWTFGRAPNVDLRLDVELGLVAPAGPPPNDLSAFKVRVLDLGWRDEALRGTVEPVQWAQGLATPFGRIRSAWGTFALGARSQADIFVGADLRLPDLLGCAPENRSYKVGAAMLGPRDTLRFLPTGGIRGALNGFVPRCTGALGPLAFSILDSRVFFDVGPDQRPSVILDGTARVAVATGAPAGSGSDSVRADGRFAIDLITGQIKDASIAITQPFLWQPDPRNPILAFKVNQARLDRDALTFTGGGELRLAGGASAALQFSDLAWGFREQRLVSGSATISTSLAVGAEIGDDGLEWVALPADAPPPPGAGFRLTLPAGMVIDRDGIRLTGTATATLAYGEESFTSISATFEDGFRLATTGPVRVLAGRAVFRRGAAETIATVDVTGFRPGDLFAVLPIPERLALPNMDVAYLVLGDATRRFVELAEDASGRTHLRTPSGRTVDLFLPALAYGGPVPKITTGFDLIVDPRTMRVVGGALQLDAPNGGSLVPLANMPVDITRLGFSLNDTDGWQLRAGARVRLPASLTQVPLVFRDVVVDRTGLSGTVQIGTVGDCYVPGLTPVVRADLRSDSLSLAIVGARLDLAAGAAPRVAIAGTITSAVIKDAQGAPAPLWLSADVSATRFEARADLSAIGSDGIPIGIGVLRPTTPNGAAPLRFVADARRTALEFGASLELTSLSPGLVVAIDTISLGSDGLRVSPLSIVGGNAVQFQLFGLNFALQDSTSGGRQIYPALAGSFDGAKLKLEMSGKVTVFENTTRFYGLKISSDGTLALAGASLLSRSIPIVEDRLFLDGLRFDQGTLRADASVILPDPFDVGAPQRLFITIAPDGRVSGGGTVTLISEPEGLASAKTKLEVGLATFHVRHLSASIDFAYPRERTSVDLVADIYVANVEANLIRLGSVSGNTVQAGLRITPTNVAWSGLQVVRPITVEIGPVRLIVANVTATINSAGLTASFGGGLGLNIEGSGGSLTFRDVVLRESGELSFSNTRFDGGSITIYEKFSLDIRNLGFSDTETTIEVPGDNTRPTGGTASVPAVRMVRVSSYLSFGASITILDVFNGGVKRVLVYRQADDNTNHILIDSLYAKVSDVFEVTASMRYDEYPDGFALQVAGKAMIMEQYGVAIVGVMSKRAERIRAGLFLAAYVDISIIPGVFTLTGVGGGFFINPEPSDIDLVRQTAGITGGPAQRMGSPPASAFAIMLYARAVGFGQGDASLVAGQVLVTVTDKAFRLDGNVVFLGRKNEMKADVALQIGWAPSTYLLGDIDLLINFDTVAVGRANLQLAIGGNAFAIKGKVALSVMSVLQADADLVIVPSGFVTGIKVTLGRTFWVVKLEAALKGEIWFRPATKDLGAYVELTGEASIPGLIGIQAYLRGALIVMPKLALYAAGGGRAYVLGESVQFQFWVSFTGSGVAGGLGENAEMNEAIERARAVAGELRAEADSIIRAVQDMVNSVTVTPVVPSDEALARVFENAKGWASGSNWLQFYGILFTVSGETVYEAGVDRTPYFGKYWGYLTQASAPSDTAAIAALRAEAAQKLANLGARRDEMLARIAALEASVDSVRTIVMPAIPNPVRRFTLGDPSVATGTGTAPSPSASRAARTPADVSGLPVFDLDDAQSAQNKATLTATAEQVNARRAEVVRALAQAQASLDGVRDALSATQSSSLMGYLRLWADAVEATEHQQAATVDYQMRRWSWTREGLAYVRDNRESLRTTVQERSNLIAGKAAYSADTKVAKFDEVASARAQMIGALGREPNFYANYQATRSQIRALGTSQQVAAMKQQADTLAMLLYNRAAELGLAALDSTMPAQVQATAAAATDAIRRVRAAHAEISGRTAIVSDAQLELYGAVYDLYDAVLRELPTTDTLAQRVTANRDAIAPLLRAPQIGTAQATVQDLGFLSRAQITFSATHPSGVPEYTITEADGLTRSLGSSGVYSTWRWTTDLAGTTETFGGQLGARAAGGTRTTRGTPPLTFSFTRGTPAAPVSSSSTALASDATPPSAVTITAPGGLLATAGDGAQILWVTKDAPASLAWSATDLESGIQEYRYRIVQRDPPKQTATLSIGPSITAAGAQPVVLVPWTSLGGRTSMLLTAPTPAAGKVAQIEITATNGIGLTGFFGALVLRQDPTPPVAPAGAALTVSGTATRAAPGRAPLTVGAVCAAGPTVAPKALAFAPSPAASQTGTLIVARPPLADPESGTSAWFYKVSTTAPTAVDGDGWVQLTDTTGAQFAIANVPFETPIYVAVAARGGAGAISAPVVTAGPTRLYDPSVAPAPDFCFTGDAGRVAVRINRTVSDPQSGIIGYQVRLKTSAGVVLRDWPAGAVVDIPGTVTMGDLVPLPGIPLPASGSLVAELRALNGSGVGGDQAASGLLLLDGTAPPTPTITSVGPITTSRTGGFQFQVTVSAPADPESGIGGIDVRVDDAPTTISVRTPTVTMVPWTAVPGAISGVRTYTIGLATRPAQIPTVYIRTRNGIGMTSLTTSAVVPQ